jgi:hypothetical protein
MRRATPALIALALLLAPATARAQDPADFTPAGYKFCGWWDFEYREWTHADPMPGAYTRLFARKMTCAQARRHQASMYWSLKSRPRARGFRCVLLAIGIEYGDYRCSKPGRPRVAFRVQGGA